MKLIWTIKLYTTGGMSKPFRVKIEGNPSMRCDVPWVNSDAKGQTPGEALNDAIEKMPFASRRAFLEFVDNTSASGRAK
jgi:hypothetical protein